MTHEEAKQRRIAWQNQGNPPCEHVILVLEHTDTGYLTGRYICTRCGYEVSQRSEKVAG
jgi:hypothetical protein